MSVSKHKKSVFNYYSLFIYLFIIYRVKLRKMSIHTQIIIYRVNQLGKDIRIDLL